MYAEFYVDTELLTGTLSRLGGEVAVEIRQFNVTDAGTLKTVCVATGEYLDEFEETVVEERAVESLEVLNGGDRRRLYNMYLSADSDDTTVYGKLVEHDGIFVLATSTESGWYLKANFVGRDEFRRYRVELSDYGIDLELTVARDSEYYLPEEPFGLSSEQEEILIEAVRTGYFEIPRRTPLAELADRTGISDQAASERLRRAQRTLAENAVSCPLD